MSRYCFLVANHYQLHHMAALAVLLEDVSVVIERRDGTTQLATECVRAAVPTATIGELRYRDLDLLDGVHDVIVCQTPPLLNRLPQRSRTVAVQYGLGKERYNYGAWRSLADLNVMYGPHSHDRVQGHARSTIAGCVLFDSLFADQPLDALKPPKPASTRARVLYSPTYGELSSLSSAPARLSAEDIDLTVKIHHLTAPESLIGVGRFAILDSSADPVSTLRSHDVVVSDHSGAVYDALYARVPVVLTESSENSSNQLSGLEREQIAHLVAHWASGEPFQEARQRAAEAISDDERYLEFANRFFANHGRAAERTIRAIESVGRGDLAPHFSRAVVAESLAGSIRTERRLAADNRRLRRAVAPEGSRWPGLRRIRFHVHERIRRALRPFPRASRMAGRVSARLHSCSAAGPS